MFSWLMLGHIVCSHLPPMSAVHPAVTLWHEIKHNFTLSLTARWAAA